MKPAWLLVSSALVFGSPAARGQSPTPTPSNPKLDRARTLAKELGDAITKPDFQAFVERTHPRVVEKSGGAEKMIEAMKKGYDAMLKEGTKVTRVEIGTPRDLVGQAPNLYCLIPERIVMDVTGGTLTARSYVIGCSTDNGESWTFIDIAPGEEAIRKHFPELPAELKIPQPTKPTFKPKS